MTTIDSFVDRDMFMRYHGGGVGHIDGSNPHVTTIADEADEMDDSAAESSSVRADSWVTQERRQLEAEEAEQEGLQNDIHTMQEDGDDSEDDGPYEEGFEEADVCGDGDLDDDTYADL
ncbi:hypothetical protein FISHEDRAFT_73360 [Fistulina hepatica ATCC 64428]|uniref:Uncharacterized protein n=1 Tax=Fistulina hepatica ATCC 64428 TaxID=1128425 RepID=A0A0D7ADJ5_9AGAR|nr:hypothetical protein FISHEDRAFT_74158 [Fistulina hepatica ATCC 64428]KIY48734.1 hypothetical protein FISHEDRAFT_73360 [Fistulina hepatica ATCC 64428]